MKKSKYKADSIYRIFYSKLVSIYHMVRLTFNCFYQKIRFLESEDLKIFIIVTLHGDLLVRNMALLEVTFTTNYSDQLRTVKRDKCHFTVIDDVANISTTRSECLKPSLKTVSRINLQNYLAKGSARECKLTLRRSSILRRAISQIAFKQITKFIEKQFTRHLQNYLLKGSPQKDG